MNEAIGTRQMNEAIIETR